MTDLLAALLLGIIEGITEFLPISSTGHLLVAERWLGRRSDLFNIAIQAGAILAVVLIYRQRLWQLAMSFLRRRDLSLHSTPSQSTPPQTASSQSTPAHAQAPRDYAYKLAAAFGVTAVGGLLVKGLGWELSAEVAPIAWALVLGGVWMLAAEHFAAKRAEKLGERSTITWTVAILVGIAQVVAGVFPGTSRSAATIFVALLAGTTNRAAATEFAFLVGIPTMFAATGYELLSVMRNGGVANEDWNALAIAFVASAVTAFIAVKWLLQYIQTHRFTAFAVYRLVVGAALLLMIPSGS
ncbi:MAG: undecaprenyl-diphosphate phosphatase [Lysobacter sp.]|nr:undecaprenyl-diphosphate phosphatase [Lysobacter sp.]